MKQKKKVYKREKARIYHLLEQQKEKLHRQKKHIEKSIDPSHEALTYVKVEETKYRLYLKEARRMT
ncbi:DUF2508 family protein [Geomicrobium sp. JCM 19038]|uniref:DUF2508 family protein n=1 Tax=Geomicrobium sp. JCM 19038 TaxID=1460635 RepID=UPI00045F26B3|nr:DUF2508 family protein [Geomicrobium sp. JCM 19038]GAK06883.1 hypothetical protein JCM19038_597 [Geomicrobium sp. JCM 19038]